MGVGPSRVGPTIPECDDISFKSDDEKMIHKKKPGIVRSIIDALLGEKPTSPDEPGCVSFSDQPDSGTDFEFEDAFVDAPLPSARQYGQWKEAKPERKVTPGRARAKRRNVASKFSTMHYTDEQSPLSSNPEGEVRPIHPVKNDSKFVKSDVHATSKMSDTSLEIPSSHGRGDHATSVLTYPKVDAGCPTRLTYQEPEAQKMIDNPCSFQNNNNSVDIPSTATQGTQVHFTVVKTSEIFALGSDGINDIESGGEATPKVKKDSNKQTHSPHNDSKTVVKIKGKTILGSNKVNSNIKSDRPLILTADVPGALLVLPPAINKRKHTFKRTTAAIPRELRDSQSRSITKFFDKKRADIFRVERERKDSHADAMPCAQEVNAVGRKETQIYLGNKTEVPKVKRIFQTQVPRPAKLSDAIAEARKELDSIQKFISASDKRPQSSNVARKQVRVETVKQTGPSTPAQSEAFNGDRFISDQSELQKKPLLCPIFDDAIPRCVVFNGKKSATTVPAEPKPFHHEESNQVLKPPSPCIDGEKSTSGAIFSKQGTTFTRLGSRNLLRRKAQQKQVNKPSGANNHPELPTSKVSVDPFDPSDAVTFASTSAPKCGATKMGQGTSTTLKRSPVSRIPPVCRGSIPTKEVIASRKGAFSSEQSRKLVDIERQKGVPKPSAHPLVPNELVDAYHDGNMLSVAMTYQRPLTCDAVNSLVRFLPHIWRSRGKYVSRSCTANLRGLDTTKVSDRDLDSMLQESLTWYERKRPAILFNNKFYPRRLLLPYFDKIGNDIELTAENYHVHGVQYLPVFVHSEDIEGETDKAKLKGVMISSEERTKEKPAGKYDYRIPTNRVLRFNDHSKTSVRFAKEHLISVLAELNRVVITFLQSRSASGLAKSDSNKPGEVLYWYREITKLSRRMNSIETEPSSAGASATDTDLYRRDQMLNEYYRVLKEFDEWKHQLNSGKESLQIETKPVIKLAVKEKGGENKNVLPIPIPQQRVDSVKPVPAESTKPTNQLTIHEFKEEPRIDSNGNEIEKEIQMGIDPSDKMEAEKDGDGERSPVSDDHDAKDTITKATAPKEDCMPDGEVTKSLVETSKCASPAEHKDEQLSKSNTKAEMINQIVSGDDDSTAGGADEGHVKRKLGRGPRIIADVRRIVHCQRRRRTDTPTTQLKVKFCLGCGDTRQPNGEALIQCGTCDEAFFCCSKCQRVTRNEHRETCKGVKRNYCKHW